MMALTNRQRVKYHILRELHKSTIVAPYMVNDTAKVEELAENIIVELERVALDWLWRENRRGS